MRTAKLTDQQKFELRALHVKDKQRILRAEAVVKAAKVAGSKLHSLFEWDNKVAGHAFRLHQARDLIANYVTFELKVGNLKARTIRGTLSLMSDRQNPGGGYRLVTDIQGNKVLLEECLRTALVELESWTHRYSILVNLVKRVSEIIAAFRPPDTKGGAA